VLAKSFGKHLRRDVIQVLFVDIHRLGESCGDTAPNFFFYFSGIQLNRMEFPVGVHQDTSPRGLILPAEADDVTIQAAITRSRFVVRFDEGTLIDGSDTRVISGRDISLIRGRY